MLRRSRLQANGLNLSHLTLAAAPSGLAKNTGGGQLPRAPVVTRRCCVPFHYTRCSPPGGWGAPVFFASVLVGAC
jgi:hypothetical protein